MTFNLLQYIDKEAEQGEQRGLVTEVSVVGGFIVLQKGVKNEDRFWEFTNDAEAAVARAEAEAHINEHGWLNSKGKKATPLFALRVNVYGGSSVLNREEPPTWDVVSNYMVTFMSEYQKVFKPLSDLSWLEDYESGSRIYAHVKYEQNPDNPTWTNADGVTKDNLVPYIVQVFDSREEAQLLANTLMSGGDYVEVPAQPDEYPYDDWNAFYLGIVDGFKNNLDMDTKVYDDLAVYGVTKTLILGARKAAEESLDSAGIPF
jgi:hypothetical protein